MPRLKVQLAHAASAVPAKVWRKNRDVVDTFWTVKWAPGQRALPNPATSPSPGASSGDARSGRLPDLRAVGFPGVALAAASRFSPVGRPPQRLCSDGLDRLRCEILGPDLEETRTHQHPHNHNTHTSKYFRSVKLVKHCYRVRSSRQGPVNSFVIRGH